VHQQNVPVGASCSPQPSVAERFSALLDVCQLAMRKIFSGPIIGENAAMRQRAEALRYKF